MRKRILFVDNTAKVLLNIRRKLLPMRKQWFMAFTDSGEKAIAMIARKPFDIVVADTRMPMMSGSALFRYLKRDHPATLRVAMARLSSRDAVMGRMKSAHQYVAKPCDAGTLKVVIARACEISEILSTVKLRKMVSQIETVPSLPSSYNELIRAVNSSAASVASIGKLVASDMGMSSKVLQLTNSVFLSRGRHVSDVAMAVGLLGLDTVKALAISSHAFDQFDIDRLEDFSLEELWNRSLVVALFARTIAKAEKREAEEVEETFIAGLLHDLGRLVLATELPDEFQEAVRLAEERGIALSDAERESIGASHSEIGGYLLRLWGLADSVCNALVFHHAPSKLYMKEFSPLTAVHVANTLANEFFSWQGGLGEGEIDERHLEDIGLGSRLEVWREECQEALRDKWGYSE